MTLTPEEIESLRIAIAESVGWKQLKQGGWRRPDGTIENTYYGESWRLPEYTTSLDAIQKAAMEKFGNDEILIDEFNYQLNMIGSSKKPIEEVWQLSALDWCVAFARTAKIWRFKV